MFGGSNNKAVGPDGVPQELLKAILGLSEGAEAMRKFFDHVLQSYSHPSEWYQSFMVLLPKTCAPLLPKELRPICLTSHLSKTFARLVMNRIMAEVQPRLPHQCCAKHRQSTDYIWTMQRVMQISHEWGTPICAIKLDLEKAFDRLDRIGLASLIVSKLGTSHPTEVKNLLAMLREGGACIPTIWGEGHTDMNSGVRQGGVESATLFAWVISVVIEELDARAPPGGWATACPLEEQAYMDDLLLWDGQLARLQTRLGILQSILDKYGLRINPSKSSLLCSGNVGGTHLSLLGHRIEALKPSEAPWEVMGLPVFPGVKESEVVAALIAKARNKFYAAQDVLCSRAPIQQRMRLLDRIIWPAMSWCIGAIFPTQSAIVLINDFHVHCVGLMAKFHRMPDDLFIVSVRGLSEDRASLYMLVGGSGGVPDFFGASGPMLDIALELSTRPCLRLLDFLLVSENIHGGSRNSCPR